MPTITLFLTSLISLLVADPVKLPIGFPPQDEANAVDNAAPEECLFLLSWAGTADIDLKKDRKAMSDIERFLSEEEIRQSLQSLVSMIQRVTREEQELKLLGEWVPKLLTHPGMVFVEDVVVGDEIQVKAGGLLDLQEHAGKLEPVIERLFRNAPPDVVTETEIDGNLFRKLDVDGQFEVLFGEVDGSLVVATNEDIAVRLIDAKSETRPMWLTELQSKSKVKDRSITMYINIAKIVERAGGADDVPPEIDSVFGITSLESFSVVSGFDESGYLSHGKLKTKKDGLLGRIFDIFSEKPITPETFKNVPADATLAVAARLEVKQLLNSLRDGWKDSPENLESFDQAMKEYKEETGLSIEDDVIPAFGEEIVVYHSKNEGGLLSGFTATVDVRNAEVAKKLESILLKQIIPEEDTNRWYGPKYFKSDWQGQTIHTFVHSDSFTPVLMPSFCVTDDRVIVSLLPQNIQTILSRGKDFKALANSEVMKSQLGEGGSVVLYNNSPEFVKAIYPWLQFGTVMAASEFDLQGVDPGIIPSGEVLARHLKPDLSTFGRSGKNFEYVTRTSLPGLDHLMMVGLVMVGSEMNINSGEFETLLSVFSPGHGNEIKSINNLKQIGLGMHNYHDVYRTFPAAVMTSPEDRDKEDKDKKPLLSWRVHLLPYMEEAALYDEFHLDEPWNSDHNIKLIEKMPKVYQAPGSKAEAGKTNYVTIRSDDSAFPGVKKISLAEIRDGTSNTIMAVETTDANAVIWTKPDDLKIDVMHPIKELVGLRKNGFLAAFCDGFVTKLSDETDPEQIEALITRDGGEVVREFE